MKLKTSQYNFFFEADDGYTLAYNALSNSLARVHREKFKLIKKILKAPNKFSFDTEDKEKLKKDLLKGYFLIDETLSELEILKMRNKIGRYSKEYLGLAIAPTLACNFDCTYCFEDKKPDTMTEETENALIKFVESRLELAKLFSVTWFGGEPTLKIDTIERLTKSFQKLCEKNNVDFAPMSMITNGYLLTRENAKKLKELNIASAQVTVDGPPEVHDKRRKLNNGKGTFVRILENIKAAMDILKIQIRINIDKENVETVEELYKIFKEYGFIDRVPFYFGHVEALTHACTDVSTLCLSTKEYSAIVIDLLKKSKEKGLLSYRYPSLSHFGFCSADKFNAYVVAPSGLLYKCWNEISFTKEYSVGSVFEENLSPQQINNLTKYLNWDPFENKKCVKCKLFPVCVGGCPYNAINNRKSENCIDFKYNLNEMLRFKYDEIKMKQKTKQ
ncbi:MAG: radical SAM protein [Candidatus Aminicenantes bacterium]|jgi:uncharacterized protein